MRTIHVCCFSSGLDDLKRKEQADDEVVLGVLRVKRRFSVFEATANQTIARTMDRLCKTRLTTKTEGFPWTKVVAIDGEALE